MVLVAAGDDVGLTTARDADAPLDGDPVPGILDFVDPGGDVRGGYKEERGRGVLEGRGVRNCERAVVHGITIEGVARAENRRVQIPLERDAKAQGVKIRDVVDGEDNG